MQETRRLANPARVASPNATSIVLETDQTQYHWIRPRAYQDISRHPRVCANTELQMDMTGISLGHALWPPDAAAETTV